MAVAELIPIQPHELVYATLLVSFIAFCGTILATLFTWSLTRRYAALAKHVPGYKPPGNLVNRGCTLAYASAAFSLFYVYRMILVLSTGCDLSQPGWFLYDMGVGIYMLLMSSFLFSVFNEMKRLILRRDDRK